MSEQAGEMSRLLFIHHSCGRNWLAGDHGGLGRRLAQHQYYVSDTDYEWGPDAVGDRTDIGHWWTWFRGDGSEVYWQALVNHDGHGGFERPGAAAGENEIIMFKSCYPNNHLKGEIDAPVPEIENNELRGQNRYSEHHTVANAKGIYLDLLHAFADKPDKLFVAVTAPPLAESEWTAQALAFNHWLTDEWLRDYPLPNVAVFDYFRVLADSNGLTKYPTKEGDSHPSPEGNALATEDFVSFMNETKNKWRAWLDDSRKEKEASR